MNETLQEQLTKINSYLERYTSLTQAEINTKLLLAQDEIVKLISSTQNKAKIRTELNKIFNAVFSTFESVLIENDIPIIQALAWDSTMLAMATFADIETTLFKDTKKSVKDKLNNPNKLYQSHTINEHLTKLQADTKHTVRGVIFNGFDEGESIQTITSNVKKVTKGINTNNARSIITTVLLESSNEAQNEVYNEFEEIIETYEYTSIDDNRRSNYCLVADGYRIKDISKAKYKPKTHWRCRSFWSAILKGQEQPKTEPITQWDSKTVTRRNELTASGNKATYSKFKVGSVKQTPSNVKGVNKLKYFDDKYLKDYLGKIRYDLYKNGKADFKDMFNIARGELLTIEQLNKRLNLN